MMDSMWLDTWSEQQSARHGGGKEITVLAKSIAHVLVVMGLGPVPSAAVNLEAGDQCSLKEPDFHRWWTWPICVLDVNDFHACSSDLVHVFLAALQMAQDHMGES